MKRIEAVYEKLKELGSERGVSAIEIADALNLDRANVSKDLNRLCQEGKAVKGKGKPVLFSIAKSNKREETVLDRFAASNVSLLSAVKQAKAAVLYPPKGLHMLILGETGVGKSMFAGLVHKYAIEMNIMDTNSPFITFNCADYANNPQLLLSQLFGTKKGAYTGADADKPGLIEKADGGILFLDEVHRLPPEGQEMFFTFMDKGTFRRLGETETERCASVLIVSATTENPESSLLKTFTRRIPMVIRIPNLSERSLEERFNLISQFFREESSRLRRPIKVSVNSMRAFLSYYCESNVGQLKTDIQLVCAKAYAEFLSQDKDEIEISSLELPQHIRQGLYKETEHRQLWNKLIGINNRYCIFDENKETMLYYEEENNESIYEMIDLRVHELRSKGVSSDELEKEMEKDINEYFKSYIHSVNRKIDISSLENVIEAEIIGVVEEIIRFSEESLGKQLSEKVYYGMAVHIDNSIDRVRKNKKITNPQLNRIRTQYSNEFNIALQCLKIIERTLDVSMPIDEAGFLTMFLVYDERDIEDKKQDVNVIVISHGASTATSMADAANKLLGVKYAVGINAPLDEKPEQVISRVREYLYEAKITSDILFLVDMGSLTTFGKEVEKEFGIKTRSLPLVSTLHVIEATRKAMMGYSLDQVYKDTCNVFSLMQNELEDDETYEEDIRKLAIITVCTTGEGSAVAIKNILFKQLKFDSSIVEIIPLNLVGKESIYSRLKNIEKDYNVIALVSSFKLNTNIPQFSLQEVLNNEAAETMQNIIDVESTYIKMGETLTNMLSAIDGKEALKDIKKFINNIEIELNIKMDTNVLIGITFHIGCMLDRVKSGNNMIEEFEDKDRFISENKKIYNIVKAASKFLNEKYSITIPEDEICYIMSFFNNKKYV
ncbi:sigma 54-interacting transcriptional regulator [Clostridium sp. SYSU_GA19001]|uniref:sigma 54-interacting transcriptional regulator n=1 Tax=Clostridium caldaquaticum TaxID=2940653 RepID=UPI002076FA96|nr:sigma-54-dependent transcriptional regulator [Clostridium caldaquaticum]MCM8712049.1 sigma 54-interacting transcriptional regulator [Clostridium caldaquaticum]